MRYAVLPVVLSTGCFNRFQTRLPTFNESPAEERRSMTLHDPLPERDIGPDTQVRPRGFNDQRSEPRRTTEGKGMIGSPVPPGAGLPPTVSEYPYVVPQ
jgi:hypothetical protein